MVSRIFFCWSLLICFSCENNLSNKAKPTAVAKEEQTANKINLVGDWKIDSVYENETKVSNFDSSPDSTQGFKFDYVKKLCVSRGESPRYTEQIGFYSQNQDSLYFMNMKHEIVQCYQVTVLKDKIVLKGNFEISYKNRNKPTFFLSRY
jgi:hypothetical protein